LWLRGRGFRRRRRYTFCSKKEFQILTPRRGGEKHGGKRGEKIRIAVLCKEKKVFRRSRTQKKNSRETYLQKGVFSCGGLFGIWREQGEKKQLTLGSAQFLERAGVRVGGNMSKKEAREEWGPLLAGRGGLSKRIAGGGPDVLKLERNDCSSREQPLGRVKMLHRQKYR